MTREALLRLVKYVLHPSEIDGGVEALLPEELDWDELYRVSLEQRVSPIVAYALQDAPGWATKGRRFADAMIAAMGLESTIHFEMEALFAALKDAGMDYCPLKGLVTKELYPLPWMRTMNDVDLLLRPEDLTRVKPILADLGFSFDKRLSVHDVYWNATRLYRLELHDRLLSAWSKHERYYARPFARLSRSSAHDYRMSLPEQYVYTLLHIDKHLHYNGLYLRAVVDFYLLRRALGAELAQTRAAVERLGLSHLESELGGLASAWFEDGTLSESQRRLGAYFFDVFDATRPQQSGYNRERLYLRLHGANGASFWKAVLPTRASVRERHPSLVKHPFLYPLCWLGELFRRATPLLRHFARLTHYRLQGAKSLPFSDRRK